MLKKIHEKHAQTTQHLTQNTLMNSLMSTSMRHNFLYILYTLLVSSLTACGQRGPLVLPPPPKTNTQPAIIAPPITLQTTPQTTSSTAIKPSHSQKD